MQRLRIKRTIVRAAMTLVVMVLTTASAWAETVDLSTVSTDLTVNDGDELTGTLGAKVKITIADGAWVTLNNANIDGDGPSVYPADYPWAGLTCLGDATIELVGTNYVRSFFGEYSGIFVPENHTLVIQGTGALTAESRRAAGIGACEVFPCGYIEIRGGSVTAIGGNLAAAIGGAFESDCGDIIITSGVKKVIAIKTGENTYSIGAGYDGTCGTVLIGGVEVVGGITNNIYTYPVINYTLSFDANGGSGTMADMALTTNEVQALTAGIFTAPEGGYVFSGWNTKADGSGTFYSDGQRIEQDLTDEPGGMATLYAMWFKSDLSMLAGDYVASDGAMLTGTLRSGAKVSIADGATVTLNGATIDSGDKWPALTCVGDATIVLADGSVNALTGSSGIYVPEGKTLTISSGTQGTGALTAQGSYGGVGIGGGRDENGGNIVITGGVITATGGNRAAGIGCGYNKCGDITISGGSVTATGGNFAAGIGAGDGYKTGCGNITISGGTIIAKRGVQAPNSIGKAADSTCGTVTIGGTETGSIATESFVYPSVSYSVSFDANGGSGTIDPLENLASNSVLALPANTFTAPTGKYFAGWNTASDGSGTGYADGQSAVNLKSEAGNVTLYAQWFDGDLSMLRGHFTALDGMTLTGKLGANVKVSIADGATVTLNGVTIDGVNDETCPWAGLTCLGDATIVLADGSENTVKGFYSYYAGIYVPAGKTLTIRGGSLGTGALTASSSMFGAGIGSNCYENAGGNITILGGVITATSPSGSGIGGGQNAAYGDITISGGIVTAQCNNQEFGSSAGIGSGSNARGSCGNISITGGIITATGGVSGGAGIGAGEYATCGNITISSDVMKLTATAATRDPGVSYNRACSIGHGQDTPSSTTPSYSGNVTVCGYNYGTGGVTESPFAYIANYEVRFDANGGDDTMGTQAFMFDVEKALTACTLTRSGYTFKNWNTMSDGSGETYTDGETVKNLTHEGNSTVTLYAQWAPITYTVAFNANDGLGTMASHQLKYDEEWTLTANCFTREGYAFAGWALSSNGSVRYTDCANVSKLGETECESKTLYACWIPVNFTVSFDANGGTGTMQPQTYHYDTMQALSANKFVRRGYTFDGWATTADGNVVYSDGQLVSNFSSTQDDNMTLYAHWTLTPFTVSTPTAINASPATATMGHTVTLTAAGNNFLTAAPTVTDDNGITIEVTQSGSGSYTFSMPAGNATVLPTGLLNKDFRFTGTYVTQNFTASDTDIYGFVGTAGTGTELGSFVRVGGYVRVKPMRAYLQATAPAQNAPARRTSNSEQTPTSLRVRLLGSDGQTTGIVNVDAEANSSLFTLHSSLSGWYTLDGMKLQGEPMQRGIYINNGKKVVIK